jgi:hypothetical protein
MRVISLNAIANSTLSRLHKSRHYYYRFLKTSSDCLRELIFDTLQITNTVRLDLNEFFEAEIPPDYVDFLKVGVQVGQFSRPLVSKHTINNLADFDTSTGNQINYPNTQFADVDDFGNLFQWWGININSQGENTGGYYGIGAGSEPDTFKIIENRNVIQCNRNVGVNKIVLEYISDGSFANAATQIPVYAQKTIEEYNIWQFKQTSKSYGAQDGQLAKQLFDRQHEILRGRKNNLTPELVERIINRNRKASIK